MKEGHFKFYVWCWQHLVIVFDIAVIKNAVHSATKSSRWTYTIAPPIPRSNPIDFFYWGYIKDIVYSTPVADLDDLRWRIVAAYASVTPKLARTWISPGHLLCYKRCKHKKFISGLPKFFKSLCHLLQTAFSSINYLASY